jgi:anthranilate phosphoribosyltransferase
MDEFSLAAETIVCEVQNGKASSYVIAPEDIGLKRCEPAELLGGDARRNASIFEEVLSGREGPRLDISVANAAFALQAGGIADSLAEGVRTARQAVESGDAMRRLEMLVGFSKDGGDGSVP